MNEPKKKHSVLGFLVSVILGLLLVLVVAGLFYLWQWDQEKAELPVPDPEEGNTLRDPDGDVLFLVAGVDDTGPGTAKRTDTLMLFRMNFTENRLVGLSIPRDTRVYVQGELDKVNAAYAYGGIEETMSTIRAFLGLDLDYYVVVDYETIRAIVDATGGIRYDIPADATPVPGEIYTTGEHVLDGDEALSWLRHRQGYQNGDLDRVQAQQDFLKEMVSQTLSLSHAWRLPLVAHAIRVNAKTNLPVLPLLPHAFHLIGFDSQDVEMHTIPGYGEYVDGISYYLPDSEGTRSLVDELFQPFQDED